MLSEMWITMICFKDSFKYVISYVHIPYNTTENSRSIIGILLYIPEASTIESGCFFDASALLAWYFLDARMNRLDSFLDSSADISECHLDLSTMPYKSSWIIASNVPWVAASVLKDVCIYIIQDYSSILINMGHPRTFWYVDLQT